MFESWSCRHVDFSQLTEVWPYLLHERFGQECFAIVPPQDLADFNDHDCSRIARRLCIASLISVSPQ